MRNEAARRRFFLKEVFSWNNCCMCVSVWVWREKKLICGLSSDDLTTKDPPFSHTLTLQPGPIGFTLHGLVGPMQKMTWASCNEKSHWEVAWVGPNFSSAANGKSVLENLSVGVRVSLYVFCEPFSLPCCPRVCLPTGVYALHSLRCCQSVSEEM